MFEIPAISHFFTFLERKCDTTKIKTNSWHSWIYLTTCPIITCAIFIKEWRERPGILKHTTNWKSLNFGANIFVRKCGKRRFHSAVEDQTNEKERMKWKTDENEATLDYLTLTTKVPNVKLGKNSTKIISRIIWASYIFVWSYKNERKRDKAKQANF